MPHLSNLKTPRAFVSVDKVPLYVITRCNNRKNTCSPSFYSVSYLNCCSASSKKILIISSSSNGHNDDSGTSGVTSASSTSTAANNKFVARWRIFGGKSLFGSKKLSSVIMLNLICFVYASNIPVVKEVENFMDPAAFSAARFTISAIPFLPFVFQAKDDVKTRNAGLELGLWISLGYLIEALGLLTCEAGRASFISLFTVLVVPFLESMLGAIVPARTWFGILMSISGIAMLECTGSPPNIGDLLNFLSAIFFGIHTLRTEQLSRSTKKENFMALLGYELCVLAVLSTIWYVLGGNFHGIHDSDGYLSWNWTVVWDLMVGFPWIPTLYTGVFSTGLCLWGEIAAMRDVSATEAAVIYGLEPLWGAGFAWFLLGERWGISGWLGAALVLGGSLIVQIFYLSPSESGKTGENQKNGDLPFIKDNQELSLTASPVIVNSKKEWQEKKFKK